MLTLLGPGGVGKTRLAIQAATQLAPHFGDGVCFVPLAGVDAPALLPATLTPALELPLRNDADPVRQVGDYLRNKGVLLLDNFEQLTDSAEFLADLVAATPACKFLVTSRQRLNLSEEWLLTVEGLATPALTPPAR